MGAVRLGELEWAAASRPAARSSELGDACLVKPVEQGYMIAVADGLGHGHDAAEAAQRAIQALERSKSEAPARMLAECHHALQATRGVVMGIAFVDARADALTWVGVGDVRAMLYRADPVGPSRHDALYTHNGVVGRTLPPLRPVMRALLPGDLLIVATDGLRGGLTPALRGDEPPERVAGDLLARHAVASDDALVLVARYRGAR